MSKRKSSETFPQRLRRLRERSGLSKSALSELCGLGANTIGFYENEVCRPGADAVISIAAFFDVSVDYILCLTDDPRAL